MDHPADAAGLIIDMDGVLWRDKVWLPGVAPFFAMLQETGQRFMLVTNNATASAEAVVDRLGEIGVGIAPAEVLTSSVATAAYLHARLPAGASIYPIGERALRTALRKAGFEVLDRADGAQAVVVGFDREISWPKLTQAALAIQRGALFVGTNPDPSFPLEDGRAPGNGAFLAALQVTTGIEPEVVGKPEPALYLQAATAMQLTAEQILVIGDRLSTDILGAVRTGMASALLLTGVTSAAEHDRSSIKADWVFEDLTSLTEALSGG